jgi:hypothetical protein
VERDREREREDEQLMDILSLLLFFFVSLFLTESTHCDL